MNQQNIYEILTSIPHNPHYLNRYIKFIYSLKNQAISSEAYKEIHHICPVGEFKQYKNLSKNPWNKIILTGRQHFIAHWFLWKSYGKTQTYAFYAMCNNQKSKYQQNRYNKINSKTYEKLKKDKKNQLQQSQKGKASYYDKDKNVIHCHVTDPRVLSGELISITKGRKHKKFSEESKKRMSIANKEKKWDRYPNRKQILYFLDIKICISYTKETQNIIAEYLEQGWQMNITKEFRTKRAIESNKNMSTLARKKAATNISKVKTGKPGSKRSIDQKKKLRSKLNHNYEEYYFDTSNNEFIYCDPLDISPTFIKVFCKNKNHKTVYNLITCETRPLNGLLINNLPPNFIFKQDLKIIKVYNKKIKKIINKPQYQFDENEDVKIFITNENRIKGINLDTNKKECIPKYLLEYEILNFQITQVKIDAY